MKVHSQEDMALLFMTELARQDRASRMSLSAIAKTHGISSMYLKKIARSLKHAQLVSSKEGIHGGYLLARDPARITVWDILQAFVREAEPQKALGDNCPLHVCLPQTIRNTVAKTLEKSFSTMTLATLSKGDRYESKP